LPAIGKPIDFVIIITFNLHGLPFQSHPGLQSTFPTDIRHY
jgi:hypothetical protein